MGCGLWELLAPVGRRVSVETLAGKRVAMDASIWMVQFMRVWDDNSKMVEDAHLLGFHRRICKLLFLHVCPIFVFVAATSALKCHTFAAHRRHRDAAQWPCNSARCGGINPYTLMGRHEPHHQRWLGP
jgi:DNA excision repair protein ERCC-5